MLSASMTATRYNFANNDEIRAYLAERPSQTILILLESPIRELEIPEQIQFVHATRCFNLQFQETVHQSLRGLKLYNTGTVWLPPLPDSAHVDVRFCRNLRRVSNLPRQHYFEGCHNLDLSTAA